MGIKQKDCNNQERTIFTLISQKQFRKNLLKNAKYDKAIALVFFWLCSELLLDLARTHGNYAKGLQQSGNDNICINITNTS